MKTNSSLAFMQAVATFSLLSSLGLAYVINPINDSLFFLALDGFVGAIYGNDVLTTLNNSVVAGILLGLFIGTVYVFIGVNKKVHDYAVFSVFVMIACIFIASVRKYDPVPYELTQQLFLWAWIGLPVALGIVGVWNNSIGNQVFSAFLILVMPLGLSGNTNEQIYPILGFVFSFMLYLELSYGHVRYSRLARVMHYSREYETVLQWFLTTLMVTLALTMVLTSLAFLFHSFLGDILPYGFSNSIEYNTIYGQALSVLVFFILWAIVQTLFSRRYLARQVED
ncbi:MAG: hypothetical protein VYE50_01895 [Candidatus Thermoplasmatota archaeon]|nr:hypothetical protein [Candidatus Thermoplasmatota archaeon]MEC9332691.1 hypothetical protein [Candidatus Thermoplasmatota archaeon]MED6305513.1 hypothetical protein [Candidatus Thermoplasmatota archaeon]